MRTKFIFTSDPIYSEIEKKIRESYPKSCIVSIYEIENDKLETRFNNFKNFIENKNGTVEVLNLFHGTSALAKDFIISEGFRKDKSVVHVYGIGSYFASTALYSFSYMKSNKNEQSYMFYCDCIVGKTGYGGSGEINTDLMDSSVDNIKKPNIFSIPHDDAIFPRYLIEFHKEAKY